MNDETMHLSHRWPAIWLAVAMSLAGCGGSDGPVAPDGTARALAATTSEVQVSGLTVTGVVQVAERRVGRTVFEYDFTVTLRNNGVDISGATAALSAVGAGTTIISGSVNLGSLAAGAQRNGIVTVRQDRSKPFNLAAWRWSFADSNVRGRILDGYLQGAKVFWDCNDNWSIDVDEPRAVSVGGGQYSIVAAPVPSCLLRAYVPSTAVDESLGAVVQQPFWMAAAPGNVALISPLTTLVAIGGQAPAELQLRLGLRLPMDADYLAESSAGTLYAANVAQVVAQGLQQIGPGFKVGPTESVAPIIAHVEAVKAQIPDAALISPAQLTQLSQLNPPASLFGPRNESGTMILNPAFMQSLRQHLQDEAKYQAALAYLKNELLPEAAQKGLVSGTRIRWADADLAMLDRHAGRILELVGENDETRLVRQEVERTNAKFQAQIAGLEDKTQKTLRARVVLKALGDVNNAFDGGLSLAKTISALSPTANGVGFVAGMTNWDKAFLKFRESSKQAKDLQRLDVAGIAVSCNDLLLGVAALELDKPLPDQAQQRYIGLLASAAGCFAGMLNPDGLMSKVLKTNQAVLDASQVRGWFEFVEWSIASTQLLLEMFPPNQVTTALDGGLGLIKAAIKARNDYLEFQEQNQESLVTLQESLEDFVKGKQQVAYTALRAKYLHARLQDAFIPIEYAVPSVAVSAPTLVTTVGQPISLVPVAQSHIDGRYLAKFVWSFGDGTIDEKLLPSTVSHTWAQPGSYDVTLTVTDSAGGWRKSSPVSILVGPAQPTAPLAGLVGHWSFDTCDGRDSSPNGIHGAVSGAPACVAGKSGGALRLNGSSDWITVPNAAAMPTTALTMSYWAHREGAPLGAFQNYISKEQSFQAYLNANGTTQFGVWLGVSGLWTGWGGAATQIPTLNDWVHYAFTYDNTSKVASTYVNGALVHTTVEADPRALVRASSNPMFIGRNGSANVYHVRGLIDEVRLYDRALSADEVRNLYLGEGTTSPPNAASKLPHTGTTDQQCFMFVPNGTYGGFIPCARADAVALSGPGKQDGMYTNINTMSYSAVARPDGTFFAKTECVKDNVTGLIWEGKEASGARGFGNTYTNLASGAADDASGYVAAINATGLCGYNDWRLPTPDELHTLVNYGRSHPAADTTWFAHTATTTGTAYWTSTLNVANPARAWGVYFDVGYVGNDYLRTNQGAVRLVRGGL